MTKTYQNYYQVHVGAVLQKDSSMNRLLNQDYIMNYRAILVWPNLLKA